MAKLSFRERLSILFTGIPPEIPQPVVQVTRTVVGSYNGFTLADWLGSDERIRYAQELFKHPLFRDLLAVLMNAQPALSREKVDPAFELGRRVGFDDLRRVLMTLPKFPEQPPPEIEADYGAVLQGEEEES